MRHVLLVVQRLAAAALLTAAALLGLGAPARSAAAQAAPRSFEYLYVEANSGDASGGHTAICFAEHCYHFQQDDERTIRLHREGAADFDYRYRLLGNRTIHASRVDVAPATYEHLRAAFQARLQVQDRQAEVLKSLHRDRTLLEQIGRRDGAADTARTADIEVPGSAYFVADSSSPAAPFWAGTQHSGVIERLADQVRAVYGDDFIEHQTAELRAAIARLVPATDAGPLPEARRLPVDPAGFATRHAELVSGWLALEVLRIAPALRAGTFHAPSGPDFGLQPAEIATLHAYATQQSESLVRLLSSQRPDWGSPMLIGMARLLAIQASIDSGHLIVLDDFPAAAASVTADSVSRQAVALVQIRDERRTDFVAARRRFFETPASNEGALSALEVNANLLIDIDGALTQRTPLRLYAGGAVPSKGALRADWPLPEVPAEVLRPAVVTAREREARYRAALAELYPYEIVSHNCVTEIFRTIEPALAATPAAADSPETVRAASTAALGGYVQWQGTLTFIPFVSAEAIGSAYHVSEHADRPSYRELALAGMSRREAPWRVDLRESNVLTARSYGYNPDDPLFLFFTDNVLLRRPLYGIANFVVGVGGALTGLVLLPVDGGATLRAGLDGALFSLPELAFMNIRKGSFAFAPRSWLSDRDVDIPAASGDRTRSDGDDVVPHSDRVATDRPPLPTARCPIADRCAS